MTHPHDTGVFENYAKARGAFYTWYHDDPDVSSHQMGMGPTADMDFYVDEAYGLLTGMQSHRNFVEEHETEEDMLETIKELTRYISEDLRGVLERALTS